MYKSNKITTCVNILDYLGIYEESLSELNKKLNILLQEIICDLKYIKGNIIQRVKNIVKHAITKVCK